MLLPTHWPQRSREAINGNHNSIGNEGNYVFAKSGVSVQRSQNIEGMHCRRLAAHTQHTHTRLSYDKRQMIFYSPFQRGCFFIFGPCYRQQGLHCELGAGVSGMCRFTGKDCLHQRSTYVHYNKSEHEDLLLYIIWQKNYSTN